MVAEHCTTFPRAHIVFTRRPHRVALYRADQPWCILRQHVSDHWNQENVTSCRNGVRLITEEMEPALTPNRFSPLKFAIWYRGLFTLLPATVLPQELVPPVPFSCSHTAPSCNAGDAVCSATLGSSIEENKKRPNCPGPAFTFQRYLEPSLC